ncbi:TetR/AcrR family transcriptional regulator [Paracoccus xiamenensis]|uniref:TetR/AcrR family transcriptional regulator n=1 Tax=Paracoccus xiamenensis TaxID=2714901 RepID=UPI00140D9C55|nr:TetR/AcrR family transcriptional regulator [Paracoccus xiamenensis]NHF74420.1 TetR/AcrR family transcriptional regulator [Paracoccus xiamenensis]
MDKNQHLSDIVIAGLDDPPRQARSHDRLKQALDTAERIIAERGTDALSIPEIENISGVPRAAIYRYYPDRETMLAGMASAAMERLAQSIAAATLPDGARVEVLVRELLVHVVGFYNEDPVASALVFGGPFNDRDRKSHDRKTDKLIALMNSKLPAHVSPLKMALAIELAFAVLRFGYFRDGKILAKFEHEANAAVLAYLSA